MNQRDKWLKLLSATNKEEHEHTLDDHPVYQSYPGWCWIEVGQNASHWFCVGRNADYTKFAVSASEYNPAVGIDDCKVYRESSDLDTTLAGAYLGRG